MHAVEPARIVRPTSLRADDFDAIVEYITGRRGTRGSAPPVEELARYIESVAGYPAGSWGGEEDALHRGLLTFCRSLRDSVVMNGE